MTKVTIIEEKYPKPSNDLFGIIMAMRIYQSENPDKTVMVNFTPQVAKELTDAVLKVFTTRYWLDSIKPKVENAVELEEVK